MDVRCTKCGIEYEFDDAKVTAAGVTVKCTNCGHVFKVKREESAQVPGSPSTSFMPQSTFAKGMDGGEWMVKRVDGQVFRFKELTTLQKWIVERKAGRDDEISKTGKTWKKLGEIAELASFFQVVDAANAAVHASVVPVSPAMPTPNMVHGLVVMPGTNPGMPTTNPGTGWEQSTVPGPMATTNPGPMSPLAPVHPQASPPPANTQQATVAGPSAPAPGLSGGHPQTPGLSGGHPRPPRRPTGPPSAENDDGIDALDDDDPVLQMIKRRRRNAALIVVFLVLVAAGGGAAVFWPQVSVFLGIPTLKGAAPGVEIARAALRSDGIKEINDAELTLSLQRPPSPAIDAWDARLKIAVIGHKREEARLALALGRADEAKALRAQVELGLASAYAAITKLRTDAPQLVEVHLASAAYQLERDGLAEQRADLESARAAAKGDAAVDAEIAAQQAIADARAALTSAPDAAALKAAAEKLPASTDDGRLVYARAALAVQALVKQKSATDPEWTSAHAAVGAVSAGDARAALLAQLLDTLKPKAGAIVDAGVAAASADAGVKGAEAPPPGPAVDEGGGATTYEQIMQKAERARVNEKSKLAHDLFTKAAKMKPGNPRPFIGMGWAALDLGRTADAVKDFKKALDLEEGLSDAEFGMAEALRFSGHKEEALEAYRTYLKMDPRGKDASTAKRAIESLQ